MVYLITGAAGYIGSLLTKRLLHTEEYRQGKTTILALARSREKALSVFGESLSDQLLILESDVRTMCVEEIYGFLEKHHIPGVDYILHCAAATKSLDMVSCPVETADGIVLGTRNILEAARRLRIKSMVYLSSMEVYGEIGEGGGRVTEEMSGKLSVFSARSCYPLGKRMAENYCYCSFSEYSTPVKIARLAQVFGRGILKTDTRVFAQIARAIINQEDFCLHTAGDSYGNYVDADDAVDALFLLLENGVDGEAYNIVNEKNTMRIREMAELAAQRFSDGKTKVVYDIPEGNPYGYAAATGLRLSGKKMRGLGWEPKSDLADMFGKMLEELTL